MYTVCRAADGEALDLLLKERTLGLRIEYNLQFFAEDANGAEKTEQPTSKKLDDARKEGQVAKSQEVATAFSLLALFLILRLGYGFMGQNCVGIFGRVYNSIPDIARTYDGHLPWAYIEATLNNAILTLMLLCAPFFIIGALRHPKGSRRRFFHSFYKRHCAGWL